MSHLHSGWGVIIISSVVPLWLGYEILSYAWSLFPTAKDPFEGM